MWYSGNDENTTRIGYATSSDGINWTKNANYILDKGIEGSWDATIVTSPEQDIGLPELSSNSTITIIIILIFLLILASFLIKQRK